MALEAIGLAQGRLRTLQRIIVMTRQLRMQGPTSVRQPAVAEPSTRHQQGC